jgi:two-component system, NarL family, sensor kinase
VNGHSREKGRFFLITFVKTEKLKTLNLSNEVLIAILSGTFIFLLFSCFLIAYILLYRKRRNNHVREMSRLKTLFNEELLKSKLEIQEQTFNYISQEIHDNVGQVLSLAKVQVNIMNENETISREMLADLNDNIGKAIGDLRNIAKSLSSDWVSSMSIRDEVIREADRINRTGLVHVIVDAQGMEVKIEQQKRLIIFRIIQEGLQNIMKHSCATEVLIRFTCLDGRMQVDIRDNGKGFDPDEVMRTGRGLGLVNMKNRALLTGGSAAIASIPDEGTTITINIPYE